MLFHLRIYIYKKRYDSKLVNLITQSEQKFRDQRTKFLPEKLFARMKRMLTFDFANTVDHNSSFLDKVCASLHHKLNFLPTFNVDIDDAVTVQKFSEIFPEYIAKAYGTPADPLRC